MSSSLRIIVTGLIAQHRLLGGVTWDYLNVVLGLKQLGHDVYYLEDSGEWPYNLDGGVSGKEWIAHDCSPNVDYLAKVMSQFELGDKWAYHFPIDRQWFGLTDGQRQQLIQSADLLLNVSGTLDRPEDYRQVPKLVYIDTDPIFTQIEFSQGDKKATPGEKLSRAQLLHNRVNAHDVHFTVGERLGEHLGKTLPDTGHQWKPTKHPIILSEWRSPVPRRDLFTTIMNWTSYKPLHHQGQTYSQKDVELKKFLELPGKAGLANLEIALPQLHHIKWETDTQKLSPTVATLLRQHPEWTPRELLTHYGWSVVDATEKCADFNSYRQYIQSSKAEWSVAKHGYVQGKSGWFSGRSACYLAAGCPVIVQDTGFGEVLTVGEGVLSFSTLEEAVAAIAEVESNYDRHAQAALDIAEEYFDSDKVLTQLLEEV